MTSRLKREEIFKKIISLCKESPVSSKEIANVIGMNYNTIRSKYVYELVKNNKLKKINRKYQTI
jgi:predicted transcriptional regulator